MPHTPASLDISPSHVTARALAVLGRVRRAVPRGLVSRSMSSAFSTTYRLTDLAATEHLR